MINESPTSSELGRVVSSNSRRLGSIISLNDKQGTVWTARIYRQRAHFPWSPWIADLGVQFDLVVSEDSLQRLDLVGDGRVE